MRVLAQCFAMDEGWAAVIGAAIGLGGAAIGAVGGYVGGRAQARGTVRGVELQLSGQRADALWQAEVDACTQFVDACNRADMKLGQVQNAIKLDDPESVQTLRNLYGITSREELLRELRAVQDESELRRTALVLRMPSALAEEARGVTQALHAASDSTFGWYFARTGGREDEPHWHQEARAKLASYHQLLKQFSTDAQRRYSKDHCYWTSNDVTERTRRL